MWIWLDVLLSFSVYPFLVLSVIWSFCLFRSLSAAVGMHAICGVCVWFSVCGCFVLFVILQQVNRFVLAELPLCHSLNSCSLCVACVFEFWDWEGARRKTSSNVFLSALHRNIVAADYILSALTLDYLPDGVRLWAKTDNLMSQEMYKYSLKPSAAVCSGTGTQ